jgi:hypothetical protein
MALAFFFDLPFMERAKGVPRIDSFPGGKDHLKEWSSGPHLCIQHYSGYFTGTEQLAKPKIAEG